MFKGFKKTIEFKDIPGLYIIPNVFTDAQGCEIIDQIRKDDGEKHECSQIHKALEFGWKFIPATSQKTKDDYLGEFPMWLNKVWDIAYSSIESEIDEFPKDVVPDHVLLNEYVSNDGCRPHTDDVKFWNNWVVGVSFGSGCIIQFTEKYVVDVYVPKNSVYVMINDARYKWTHGIPFADHDLVYGDIVPRDTRISLTFRTIHNDYLSDVVKNSVK